MTNPCKKSHPSVAPMFRGEDENSDRDSLGIAGDEQHLMWESLWSRYQHKLSVGDVQVSMKFGVVLKAIRCQTGRIFSFDDASLQCGQFLCSWFQSITGTQSRWRSDTLRCAAGVGRRAVWQNAFACVYLYSIVFQFSGLPTRKATKHKNSDPDDCCKHVIEVCHSLVLLI